MKKTFMLICIAMLLFNFSAFMIFAGEEKEAEAEVTVIKVIVSGALAMDSLEPLTREFEEANPDIKVELNIVSA